jgi:hypothetical protein
MAVDANRQVSQREVALCLGAAIGSCSGVEIEDLEVLLASELGFTPTPFALLGLVAVWNSLAGSGESLVTVDYIDNLRMEYLEELQAMREMISKTERLGRVFPGEWFDAVLDEIIAWDGMQSFTTSQAGAFISFLQFGRGPGSLLQEIDKAFARLNDTTGRTLAKKLRDIPRNLNDGYVSTVFEILVTSRFEHILDYEPKLQSGTPEARVLLAGQKVLIEAIATRDMQLGGNVPTRVAALVAKARDKYAGQLSRAEEPVILFFGLNIGVHDLHTRLLLGQIANDPTAHVLSGIVFSPTFHAQNFQLWINPAATFPLSADARAELIWMFNIEKIWP